MKDVKINSEKSEKDKVIKEEVEPEKGHFFINLLIIIILLGSCLYLYVTYLGVKGLYVKEYRVESEILTPNFSGIKIAHFSDLLFKSTVTIEDIKVLVDKMNEYKPDVIVFTGDLVKGNTKLIEKDYQALIDCLTTMKASLGKYAIKGDNDYTNDYIDDILTKSNFKILNNSYEEIYNKDSSLMYLVGIPSTQKENLKLDEAFKFYKEDNRVYTIVLIHEGNVIEELDKTNHELDLILGGHSLNGSIYIPYYGSLFVDKNSSKYYSPYYSKGITDIYISSGIGTEKYPYRLLNKPSFNIYRLKSLN